MTRYAINSSVDSINCRVDWPYGASTFGGHGLPGGHGGGDHCAGRGIGRAEALELAGQGAAVVVGDLDESAARQTVAEIADRGGAAVASVGDTATTEAASQLVTTALEHFGRLDAVVNNAGLLRDRTVAKMTDDEWDEVVRANLRGHFVVSRAAIRHWHAVGTGGRIVCTTSTSGLLGGFGQANYGSAKAGIAAFTQILAQEG